MAITTVLSNAMRDVITANGGVRPVAAMLRRGEATVSRWQSEQTRPEDLPRLGAVTRLQIEGQTTVVSDVMASLVELRPVVECPTTLALRVGKELGEMCEAIRAADADGQWTFAEKRRALKEARDVRQQAEATERRLSDARAVGPG